MFEDLAGKFEDALKSLRGQDRITESNIEPALKTVRRALLEADVNLTVVNEFLQEIKQDACGTEVVRGITPDQKFIDVVHKKLVHILGDENAKLTEKDTGTTVLMLVGLQGAGKTTATAKLARYLKEQGKNILMIAADTFRPAAKDQLKTLGKQIDVPVYAGNSGSSSLEIATDGINKARAANCDVAIVDTAGRLYIDTELMDEVVMIKESIQPDEVLLVVDSMIGQEAADLTKVFNEKVGLSGAILTKLDGDSRGGAALSIKKISGKPIKFIGTGEKVEALEPFYPDRIASRILGMGDILTLVDKAQKEVEIGDVMRMQQKFEEASFDFTDFLQQMKLIKRMGSLGGLIKLLPGMNKIDEKTLKSGESQLKKIQAMIDSMNKHERRDPKLLAKSPQRRKRIAAGSGYSLSEVDKMITDFERMRGMMQGIVKGDFSKFQGNPMMASGPFGNTSAAPAMSKSDKNSRRKEPKKKKGFFDL
jgi:signal recognition particle subunit SRP54